MINWLLIRCSLFPWHPECGMPPTHNCSIKRMLTAMTVPPFTGYQVLRKTKFFHPLICCPRAIYIISQHDEFSTAHNDKLSGKKMCRYKVCTTFCCHMVKKKVPAAKQNCYKELILRHKENPCSKTFFLYYSDLQKLSFTHDHRVTGSSFEF